MQGQAQSMDATASPYPGPLFGATDYARQTNQIHDDAVIAHQILVAVAGTDGADALALLLAVCSWTILALCCPVLAPAEGRLALLQKGFDGFFMIARRGASSHAISL